MRIDIADGNVLHTLDLPEGACVLDALQALNLDKRSDILPFVTAHLSCHSGLDVNQRHWICGIYGQKCRLDRPLVAYERVEIYRPLRIDPKARRTRLATQHKS